MMTAELLRTSVHVLINMYSITTIFILITLDWFVYITTLHRSKHPPTQPHSRDFSRFRVNQGDSVGRTGLRARRVVVPKHDLRFRFDVDGAGTTCTGTNYISGEHVSVFKAVE